MEIRPNSSRGNRSARGNMSARETKIDRNRNVELQLFNSCNDFFGQLEMDSEDYMA